MYVSVRICAKRSTICLWTACTDPLPVPLCHSQDFPSTTLYIVLPTRTYSEKMMNPMLYIAHHPDETTFNLMSHLYLFLDSLMRSCASSPPPSSGGMSKYYLEWAFAYIVQNFHNEITVADIADSCKIHRNYLCRIFRKHIGVSPQEFLITFWLRKAVQLLRTTKLSIKDIGNAVGYPNQLHFSRAFKNVYGMSPKQWCSEQALVSLDESDSSE